TKMVDRTVEKARAAHPSQEQPAAPAPNPTLAGGCACTATEQCAWHQMFGRFFAAPSTPEGEPDPRDPLQPPCEECRGRFRHERDDGTSICLTCKAERPIRRAS